MLPPFHLRRLPAPLVAIIAAEEAVREECARQAASEDRKPASDPSDDRSFAKDCIEYEKRRRRQIRFTPAQPRARAVPKLRSDWLRQQSELEASRVLFMERLAESHRRLGCTRQGCTASTHGTIDNEEQDARSRLIVLLADRRSRIEEVV
jgi:hypothetical protein